MLDIVDRLIPSLLCITLGTECPDHVICFSQNGALCGFLELTSDLPCDRQVPPELPAHWTSSITRAIRTLIPRSNLSNTNRILLIYPPSRHAASPTPTTERPSKTRRTILRTANPSHYLEPGQGTRLPHAPNPPYRTTIGPPDTPTGNKENPLHRTLLCRTAAAVSHGSKGTSRAARQASPQVTLRGGYCARATRGNKLRDRAHISLTMTEMGKGAWLGAGDRAGCRGGSCGAYGCEPAAVGGWVGGVP
jgi:hypothetical protein